MYGFKSVTFRILSKLDKRRQVQNISGIALVLVLICGLMGVLYFNTNQFNKNLSLELTNANKMTSLRIANQVNYLINRKLSTIDELNKTIETMPVDVISEQFFARYKRLSGLTELFIVDKDCDIHYGVNGHYEVLEWLHNNDLLVDKSTVAVPNNGIAIIDSVDIKDQRLFTVGYIDKSYLMNLMISYFEGKNYTMNIINSDATLIAGSRSLLNTKVLDIIRSEQSIHNKLVNIRNNSQSQSVFTLPDTNNRVILTSIGNFDAILMTIVPEALLTNEMSGFVQTYNMILFYFVIAFVLLIILLVLSFNRNIQLVERVAYTDEMTKGYNNTAFLVYSNQLITKL